MGLRHVPDRCGGLAYQPEAVVVVWPPRPPSRMALWLPYLPVPFAAVFGTIDLWQAAGVGPVLMAGIVLSWPPSSAASAVSRR
jgi:hypothetical protein